MATYNLKATQFIPVTLDVAWAFFSNPANLQSITPARMNFRIISRHHGDTMYPGQIIEYKVSPLGGISMYWMTEITHVRDRTYFVDEQRFGPYSLWHHQHHFKEVSGGVEMTDIVHYKIPLGFIGDWANRLFIRKQLEDIFAYRVKRVEEIFG
ncbi:MAG: SRPBCC family protein [Chitinophagaceae bacterium]|nr:SRPBCC family protein [Chitinophagaceae bacterium]